MKMESLLFKSGRHETKYISNNKYLQTKIHYGNKQFVFQISDSKPTKEQDMDSNQFSGSHDVQNSSMMNGSEFKLKVETKFEDIDELEINLNENTITIITRQNLKQFKQSESTQKKPGSWVQSEFIQKEDGNYMKIQGKYLKDVLTKHVYHKNYITIAEKIKKCCDGQIVSTYI